MFLTDPRYANLERVWLWEEFPGRKDFGGTDLGIDLVARTDTGDYWAIQCKCYDEDTTIEKGMVDSFLANSIRTFTEDETFQTRGFSNLVWVETTRRPWGVNAQKAITNLTLPFNKINLYELESSSVDWLKLRQGLYGKKAQLSGKQPRAHQLRAMAAAHHRLILKTIPYHYEKRLIQMEQRVGSGAADDAGAMDSAGGSCCGLL